ncbi:MAG: RluA family pseudouridine synthase [Oscillospiraceae bacterium]|nr:RluA family pseudouridine synthase [Oscillospiraceae bacterium]
MRELIIGNNDAGQRLDRFVIKAVPALSPSLAQKYIRTKRIKLNGRRSGGAERLGAGDTVQLYINDEFFPSQGGGGSYMSIMTPGLDIIYEDSNILLADKRAGVLCHPGDGELAADADTLIARVLAHLYQSGQWSPEDEATFAPALCNRLDRNTSGIVIAAKNAESLRIINEKIRTREIDKHYLAAVHGTPDPPSGTLENYIFKDSAKNKVFVSDRRARGARWAATEYNVVASAHGLALLECKLVTGRTHQIRAQLAHIGHPLLGDEKYGRGALNSQYGEKSQALRAHKLAFAFESDAGSLNYLRGAEFKAPTPDFGKKYFGLD